MFYLVFTIKKTAALNNNGNPSADAELITKSLKYLMDYQQDCKILSFCCKVDCKLSI